MEYDKIIHKELTNILEFFTEKRLRCLSILAIEKEAKIPIGSLNHFVKRRRATMNYRLLDSLIPVLMEFGYKPVSGSSQPIPEHSQRQ